MWSWSAGLGSLVRVAADFAVVALLGSWAPAQCPYLLRREKAAQAHATPAVVDARVLWPLAGGATLFVRPSSLPFGSVPEFGNRRQATS